ncbi:MAG: S-methyl-5'-thioadenosine phosphorylase [Phycisphaerales bacterium]|nr:S-methyl-5'-thioadenosine phosphorylase [Phycisphaerales bacterium]
MIGLIGGTGLGQALFAEVSGEAEVVETPFGKPSAAIIRGACQGMEVAFLPRHGPEHTLPPSAVPYRANIYALKKIGVTHILASGATGSLREEIRPRDLVIPDQVIDRTTQRVSTFFGEPGVAAHIEFAEPFCPTLRQVLLEAGGKIDANLHDGGTYVCMEGPAFSSVAESRMHRAWGGDLIGMTCMPEAKLAREAEICYGLICLPTDYDCWRPHDPSMDKRALLKEILGHVQHATANSIKLLQAVLQGMANGKLPSCDCRNALSLAVWTKPDNIDLEVRRRLGVILERYSNSTI